MIVRLRRTARSVRSAGRTAIFFLKVLPMLPSAPVNWITKAPMIEHVRYPTRAGCTDGDVYRPSGGGRAPGMVVCLGVVPFGVDHPQVPRLGEALARSGFAALLYWSPAMRDRRLDPGDTEDLALAYRWLIEQPFVDPSRSGLLGTCVGGAFALMAATDPAIRDRVAFVAAFAPYSSMWTLALDIASGTRIGAFGREAWDVDPLTREVFVRSVTAVLSPSEQQLVRVALDAPVRTVPDGLSREAMEAYRLLAAPSVDDAERLLAEVPLAMRDRLSALSPLAKAQDLRAPLVVFGHDRDDQVIPVSESRQLHRALAGRTGVHYTEFALFRHATPRPLPLLPLARELVRFYRYVYPLFRLTERDQT